jgi:hypothetical protein
VLSLCWVLPLGAAAPAMPNRVKRELRALFRISQSHLSRHRLHAYRGKAAIGESLWSVAAAVLHSSEVLFTSSCFFIHFPVLFHISHFTSRSAAAFACLSLLD